MALEKIRPRVVDETGNYTFNNVTATGTLVSVNANLGNIARANFFSTDNLLYANGVAYNIGAGSVVGTDTQVQFNDGGGAFGAKSTFTFTKSTDTLTVTNITANGAGLTSLTGANVTGTVANATYATSAGTATTATTSGTVTTNAQPNITSVGSLTSLTVTGNLISGNANLGNSTTSNYYSGNGFFLTSLPGGNVLGQVTYAGTANSVAGSNVVGGVTYASTANAVAGANVLGQVGNALIAGTVTTNAQPNITSVGTLTSLDVTGNVSANYYIGNGSQLTGITITGAYSNTNTAAYLTANPQTGTYSNTNTAAYLPTYTGNISANYFIGNGSTLTNITGANITGNVSSAVQSHYANIANSVSGTNVSGNVTSAVQSHYANIANSVTFANVSGTPTTLGGYGITDAYSNTNTAAYLTANPQTGTYSNTNTAAYLTIYTGNLTAGNINLSFTTTSTANLGNSVTANFFTGSGAYLTSVIAVTAGTVTTNAQPHITSVGTLSNLIVGNATANTTFGNGTITATGNISFTGANVSLGSVSSLKITGGTAGYFLSTDGAGGLSWGAANGGGGASVSGSNTQIQFNDGGVLGANANLSFDKNTKTLTVDKAIHINGANLGSNVSNIYVGGGGSTQILSTDGSGNLTWIAQPTAVITVDNFTGNGVQTAFTLTTTPSSINQTVVNYNGAFQLRSAYTVIGPTITFSEAPANGSLIEVTTTQGTTSGSGAFVTRTYTGNGVATTFTVTSGSTVSSVLVTENGLVQVPTTDYTIAGSTLTFNTAPANGVVVQIRELAIALATTNSPVYRAYTGNGVANTFTITSGLTANSLIIAENGIIQRPITDYSVSGSNVIFINAPANGIDVQIRELSLNGGMSSGGISLPTQTSNSGKYLTTDGATASWANVSGGSALTIKEEGSNLTTTATSIDFVGAGVTATNTGNAVTVTIPSGSNNARTTGYSLVFGG